MHDVRNALFRGGEGDLVTRETKEVIAELMGIAYHICTQHVQRPCGGLSGECEEELNEAGEEARGPASRAW